MVAKMHPRGSEFPVTEMGILGPIDQVDYCLHAKESHGFRNGDNNVASIALVQPLLLAVGRANMSIRFN